MEQQKKKKKRKKKGYCKFLWKKLSNLVVNTTISPVISSISNNSFLGFHFFLNGLKVQVVQINPRVVLGQLPPQQLKAFEVLTKEHVDVLIHLLKSLHNLVLSLGSLVLSCLELLVLLLYRQFLSL